MPRIVFDDERLFKCFDMVGVMDASIAENDQQLALLHNKFHLTFEKFKEWLVEEGFDTEEGLFELIVMSNDINELRKDLQNAHRCKKNWEYKHWECYQKLRNRAHAANDLCDKKMQKDEAAVSSSASSGHVAARESYFAARESFDSAWTSTERKKRRRLK